MPALGHVHDFRFVGLIPNNSHPFEIAKYTDLCCIDIKLKTSKYVKSTKD